MSHSNLELLRLLMGDAGIAARDVTSGDAASTEFYLSAPPILGNSQEIRVGGTVLTEVASAPGATEYTLDDRTGRIIFGAAPASGTNNIVATYLAVEIPDDDLIAALEANALTSTTAADAGPSSAMVASASLAATFMAARSAALPASISVDGQTITRRGPNDWAALAAQVVTGAAITSRGLSSMAIIRVDGYNTDDTSTQDIAAVESSGRRRYYGEEDRLP